MHHTRQALLLSFPPLPALQQHKFFTFVCNANVVCEYLGRQLHGRVVVIVTWQLEGD